MSAVNRCGHIQFMQQWRACVCGGADMSDSEEVDTILEADVKKVTDSIVLFSDTKQAAPTKEKIDLAYPCKTWIFPPYPRTVYCTLGLKDKSGRLIDPVVRLCQTGEGVGVAYLTFHLNCNSRRSTVNTVPAWWFEIKLWDVYGSYVRAIYLGSWSHTCRSRLVELKENFSWVPGAINPVINAHTGQLRWYYPQKVHECP
jgi:hypothetical protein